MALLPGEQEERDIFQQDVAASPVIGRGNTRSEQSNTAWDDDDDFDALVAAATLRFSSTVQAGSHMRNMHEASKAEDESGVAPRTADHKDEAARLFPDNKAATPWAEVGVGQELASFLMSTGRPFPNAMQKSLLLRSLLNRSQIVLTVPCDVDRTDALKILAAQSAKDERSRSQGKPLREIGSTYTSGYRQQMQPTVLILSPTRDFAREITRSLRELVTEAYLDLRVQPFYGGIPYIRKVDRGFPDIDIALTCVGRLLEQLECGALGLQKLKLFIRNETESIIGDNLDNADEKLHEILRRVAAGVDDQELRTVLTGPKLSTSLGLQIIRHSLSHKSATIMHLSSPPATDATCLAATTFINIRDLRADESTLQRIRDAVPGDESFHVRIRAMISAAHQDKARMTATGAVMVICANARTVERTAKSLITATTGEDGTEKLKVLTAHGTMHERLRAANNDAFNEGKARFFVTTPAVGSIGRKFACKPLTIAFDHCNYVDKDILSGFLVLVMPTGRIGNDSKCTTLLDPYSPLDRRLIGKIVACLLKANKPVVKFMWVIAALIGVTNGYEKDIEYEDRQTGYLMVLAKPVAERPLSTFSTPRW